MFATIRHIEYVLPASTLDNEQLSQDFEDWSAEKIYEKTGIHTRHVTGQGEFASDLGVEAASKLLANAALPMDSIDYLLLCTQSPDYYLPTTACLIQERLGLPTSVGALDFNLGCSGYVAGLGLAKGLIESGQARNIILITAETYSKFIHPKDKSVRTLFGDAASATWVQGVAAPSQLLGPFVYGTDGRGAKNLIVPNGGLRNAFDPLATDRPDDSGNIRTCNNLYMNGAEIYTFTLKNVPRLVTQVLESAGLAAQDIDHFVFHQANGFMLEALRKKIQIPKERFPVDFADCGNTVSSTIPIVLKRMMESGTLRTGQKAMLVGFGVGYSWAGALFQPWEAGC